ncbi:hypothetical protein PAAG_08054 [Paracoccidioides lutzii Pb01]|uniref:Uncharacterized protein n=1 Tax=Paracoccidioides lutzii (strain ATCC MYA-826 / Pb01) TaxID=502779 RepID=C1HBB3_PARBA|nr:hypothetical protein PAAG_08054 [Paracoccidioides lutzii Pb01]EEH37636.2 hypothetical protein PAAG_08054 [Paracoccidioides lutzii Pb01]
MCGTVHEAIDAVGLFYAVESLESLWKASPAANEKVEKQILLREIEIFRNMKLDDNVCVVDKVLLQDLAPQDPRSSDDLFAAPTRTLAPRASCRPGMYLVVGVWASSVVGYLSNLPMGFPNAPKVLGTLDNGLDFSPGSPHLWTRFGKPLEQLARTMDNVECRAR